ncbi:MAG: tetraacyldisaccharide 4'-kinase [Alphaproteobacteria bacterium]|nr:tetraacyldisaccharide 4'-kinase [Alphaproteobacteria bacterium]
MRAPEFWGNPRSRIADLLSPLAGLYSLAGRLHRGFVRPVRSPVPVICVGNVVAGGAGKTPTAIAVARFLKQRGRQPHLITRGYGGNLPGPVRVASHGAAAVGDEALLLAEVAPTWVARDRVAGANAAVAAGADVLVLDDGLQNPALVKDVSLLVVDGGYGFGNGRRIPAGPLRELPVEAGKRASAVVLVADDGGDVVRPDDLLWGPPVYVARLAPTSSIATLADQALVAFAGIGRPQKFFNTLVAAGCRVVGAYTFPDHHVYRDDEIMKLVEIAVSRQAKLVTTTKDAVRLPTDARRMLEVLAVELTFEHSDALAEILAPIFVGPATS